MLPQEVWVKIKWKRMKGMTTIKIVQSVKHTTTYYNIAQYTTVHYNNHCMISTAHYNIQYKTVQYNMIQYNKL